MPAGIALTDDNAFDETQSFGIPATIIGSPTYWKRVRNRLNAVTDSLGPPTFFLTFTVDEAGWGIHHALENPVEAMAAIHRRWAKFYSTFLTDKTGIFGQKVQLILTSLKLIFTE